MRDLGTYSWPGTAKDNGLSVFTIPPTDGFVVIFIGTIGSLIGVFLLHIVVSLIKPVLNNSIREQNEELVERRTELPVLAVNNDRALCLCLLDLCVLFHVLLILLLRRDVSGPDFSLVLQIQRSLHLLQAFGVYVPCLLGYRDAVECILISVIPHLLRGLDNLELILRTIRLLIQQRFVCTDTLHQPILMDLTVRLAFL